MRESEIVGVNAASYDVSGFEAMPCGLEDVWGLLI